LAYRDAPTIQAAVQFWEFDRFAFFDQEHTQAYLLGSANLIVMAFRGTQMRVLRDWMTDVKIALVPSCGGQVHGGFAQALDHIWEPMRATIAQWHRPQQAILVTGHSLGAALATIAAARLRQDNRAVHGLYTYGSPRVGDRAFAQQFDRQFEQRAFRFVNHYDLVTRLPPRSLGYQHVGTSLYYDEAGVLHRDKRYWEKFLETVQGGMDEVLSRSGELFKDHDMEEYAKLLQLSVQPLEEVSTQVGTEE
jgi:triacylglycerol lipase